ncbi:MAG: HAD-IIB family hydrolase [Eubacteriales bacterium]|nr:HAD-IIB family hydrolase [Eubacteriales bacterium]
MKEQKIRLIVSDLDGTLIPEGTQQVEDGFFDVLEELLDRGYLFYAASGRQYANIRRLFDRFADRIGFVCENGALAMERERMQYILEIPWEKARAIAEDMMSFAETDICLSGVKACYIKPRSQWFENQMLNVLRNETRLFESLDDIDDRIVKLAVYVYDFPKNAARIRAFLEERYGDYADFVRGGNDWLDMILKHSGKGPALQAVLREKGLKPEEMLVFGDNQNDISMLELTPNSYVMEHSSEDVKRHAAHTTGSVTATLREILMKS